MLCLLFLIGIVVAEAPSESDVETDEQPPDGDTSDEKSEDERYDEELIIYDVATARQMLDEELTYMGYIKQVRRKGRTVYHNRKRWKPTIIVHDSGWMQLRSPVFKPRLLLMPPLIGFHGSFVSKRKIEQQKTTVVEQTAPLVNIWRDAIASEAAWDSDYEAPEHTVPGRDGGDVAREIIGLTTGADPFELAEHPVFGRLGGNGFPLPDQSTTDAAWVELVSTMTGPIQPAVYDAILHTPRHPLLPQALWEVASADQPITTDDGVVAGPGEVAWQLSVIGIEAGDRVLERSGALGWRVAVLEAMGAQVSRSGDGPFDLILLEDGHAEEAALLPLLAPGGRLVVLKPGRLVVVQDGQRRTILRL